MVIPLKHIRSNQSCFLLKPVLEISSKVKNVGLVPTLVENCAKALTKNIFIIDNCTFGLI